MENQWKEHRVRKYHKAETLKEKEKLWSVLKLVNDIVLQPFCLFLEQLSCKVTILSDSTKETNLSDV